MHNHFLLQALALARIRHGFCAPNPSVGAIIVKNNEILATGFHYAAGEPHAEVVALNKLTLEQARDAIIYVTLEPCCHYGKTPPCTDLLISRQIKQVFYGFADPNPIVKNNAIKQLQDANIACELIPLPEISKFYRSYHYWQITHKPFVTAKLALSLDGKIALPRKLPIAISGPEALRFTHQSRRMSDAILTTATTINQDNPQLNARIDAEIIAKPIFILDRELTINPQAKIFTTAKIVTLFYDKMLPAAKIPHFPAKNIHLYPISLKDFKLDLEEVMQHIGSSGCHDLWVEAGGTLVENLILEKKLQKLYLYIAPICLGYSAVPAFTKNFNISKLAQSINWHTLGVDGLCEVVF